MRHGNRVLWRHRYVREKSAHTRDEIWGAFAAARRERDSPACTQECIVSVAREDLFARHALPFAPIVLGQSRIDDRTETEKRRRLLRARKRAHEGARRLETCGRQEVRELR